MSNNENRMIHKKKKDCICIGCPTYNECAQKNNELLFCFLGKSLNCIKKELGCICPACPITQEMELENDYFCTRGSEKEQSAK